MAEDKKGLYVANRNIVVSTEMGHTIRFIKDAETFVPPAVRKQVLSYGILPVGGQEDIPADVTSGDDPGKQGPEVLTGEERDAAIKQAMLQLREANQREKFTGQGVPRTEAVEAIIGFDIHAKERDEIWRQIVAESAAE